jgi:hypothetical protein
VERNEEATRRDKAEEGSPQKGAKSANGARGLLLFFTLCAFCAFLRLEGLVAASAARRVEHEHERDWG